MRMPLVGSCLVAALALAGCFQRAVAPATAPALATAPPPSAADNLSGATERAMANCPCTVPGATTRLVFHQRAVELIIDGPPRAVPAIQRLAARQLERHAAPRERGRRHTSRGTGTGAMGACPIVHPGTDLALTVTATGVRVLLTPRDPRQVRRLRVVAASRVQAVRTRALISLIDRRRW